MDGPPGTCLKRERGASLASCRLSLRLASSQPLGWGWGGVEQALVAHFADEKIKAQRLEGVCFYLGRRRLEHRTV